MKTLTRSFLLLLLSVSLVLADDARTAFTAISPGRSVASALKKAATEKKQVLVFVADPKKNQSVHLKATLQNQEAQKALAEHLIVVLTDTKDKLVAKEIEGLNPEHPAYVLFNADGTVASKGGAGMGPARGYEWMKELVAAK